MITIADTIIDVIKKQNEKAREAHPNLVMINNRISLSRLLYCISGFYS